MEYGYSKNWSRQSCPFATLAPLLSSYEAVLFLGETYNKAQITSGLIIIVGILINTWPTSQKPIVEQTVSK